MKHPREAKIHEPLSRRTIVAGAGAAALAPLGLAVVDLPELDPEPELEPLPKPKPAPKPDPPAATLRMQPEPMLILSLDGEAGRSRVEARLWRVGQACRCRLCPDEFCSAMKVARIVEICLARFHDPV